MLCKEDRVGAREIAPPLACSCAESHPGRRRASEAGRSAVAAGEGSLASSGGCLAATRSGLAFLPGDVAVVAAAAPPGEREAFLDRRD